MMEIIPFGVQYTHSFNFEGISRGWRCRCKLLLKMHSRDAAWHRAAKGCNASVRVLAFGFAKLSFKKISAQSVIDLVGANEKVEVKVSEPK